MRKSIQVAVVGYGYWGPNLVRNFSWLDDVQVKYVCDADEERLNKVKSLFPNVKTTTTNYQQALEDSEVTAIAISTPVGTHFQLALTALEAGKHVLVEKPMTDKAEDAKKLIELAEQQNRVLMVDHTFLYTGAVKKIKELVSSGQIGEIYYFDSVRVNLGLFQSDVNVIWDLAPHDLSIMRYVIEKQPESVAAFGVSHVQNSLENIAYLSIFFGDNTIGHIHINWLSPIKVRQILIGGSEKMIVYNDLENTEKVKVYDSGVEIKANDRDAFFTRLFQYRTGDMYAPKLNLTEPLRTGCRHFIDCIRGNDRPVSDGVFGLEIVKMLEAAQISMGQQGRKIRLKDL